MNETEKDISKMCEYCGKELPEKVVYNVMLFEIFGYVYCSKECLDAHLAEK